MPSRRGNGISYKEQGLCVVCKTNKQTLNNGGYRLTCWRCTKYKLKDKPQVCHKCGFIPKHICQLDIHHIDKNHFNNDSSNLLILCANCHRLEHI